MLSLFILLCPIIFTQAEQKRPNVLVILADDVGIGDIPGYYNDTCKVTKMENIKNLASKGLVFEDAHATPLCAASRYAFLSGNYQIRGTRPNGVWDLRDESQFKEGQKSIADMFVEEGYDTAMFGKWHVGGKILPNGRRGPISTMLTHPGNDWSRPIEGFPQDIGFNSSLVTIAGVQNGPYSFFRDGLLETETWEIKHWEQGEYSMPRGTSIIMNSAEGDRDWDSTAYNQILVNEAIRFLDEHLEKRPSNPFFTYFATGSAHIPHSPPKSYIDGSPVEKTQFTAHMDMLYELDLVVGSLLKALEDRNLIEDTIIVFTSDNGGLTNTTTDSLKYGHQTNGRLKGFKGSLHEGGHTVPLIMRHDRGLPSGERRKILVGITDLFRTLCEMADITVPKEIAQDSISFAEYARNETATAKLRWNYGIWNFNTNGCALRTRRYKLILKEDGTEIFYDLSKDPFEAKNLSLEPRYKSTLTWMKNKLLGISPCFI